MCTYNGSRFLPEQLASIAAQSRLPDELVICDDGSSDGTAEIIEEFARTAPFPVRLILNIQNLGSTKNFEKAIGLCTGDLIALSDQDDIWLPHKLARQAEVMESVVALGGLFTDAELIDDRSQMLGRRLWPMMLFTLRKQKRFRAGKADKVLLNRNIVTGATLMFRAELRTVFSPIPKSWYHDGWIAWMLVLYSKLDFIEDSLIWYRIHANQQAGIENFNRTNQPTFSERLRVAKREEPNRYLTIAGEMRELEQRLEDSRDRKASIALCIRHKIEFFQQRGMPYASHFERISWILRNTSNYYRYELGWKCLVRDIVLVFV